MRHISIFSFVIIILCMVLSIQPAVAQIALTDNATAEQLASTIAGRCVTILNPTLSCNGISNGLFTNGAGDMGIDSGIVLTSGRVVTVNPNNSGQTGVDADYDDFASNSTGGGGDADLTTISGQTTHDACVLEFDFVPLGASVNFNYVFASEEYHYVPTNGGFGWNFNCSINDVFGFFISGPGYSGLTNIALVPGTDIPVGVSTVNDGVDAAQGNQCYTLTDGNGPYTGYYNNNSGSASFVYSGYTDVFTATAAVTPCDTFHLKLAIADASDGIYDSGVFLQAGSLSSPPALVTSASSGIGIDTNITNTIRGCPPATVSITRSSCLNVPLTIQYTLEGDAVNGVDYEELPGSVVIPVGETTADIDINGLLTAQPTGPKQVIINFLSPDTCDMATYGTIIARDTVTIFDSLHVDITHPDTAICLGASVNLHVEGETYYSYQWTPTSTVDNPNGTDVTVTPTAPGVTDYMVQAWIPGIVCPPASDHVAIDAEPGPRVNLGPDKVLCTGDSAYLFAAVTPTTDTYTYEWHPGTNLSDSTAAVSIFNGDFLGTETIIVTATTPVGCKGKDTINVTMNTSDFIRNAIVDTGICPGTEFQYDLRGADSFRWVPSFGLSDAYTGNPLVTAHSSTDYTVYGYLKGCIDSQILHVEVHPEAVISLPDSVRIWPGESYQLDPQGNCLYYAWFPPSGLSASNISNPVASPEVRTRYFVTGQTEYGCEANDSIDVLVETESLLDAPNAFTPGNGPNNVFKVIRRGTATLKVFAVYDRWGNKVFETNDIDKGWDGTYNGQPQPLGVYVYRIEAVTATGRPFTKQGNVTLIR